MQVKWIKVATDMFDNRKIKQIESQANADTMLVIWLKVLALAGRLNNGGRLMLTEKSKYTDKSLAFEFGRSEKDVAKAMKLFCSLEMVAKEKGVYIIRNWEKYQYAEALEAIRDYNAQKQRESRERKRQKNNGFVPVIDNVIDTSLTMFDCQKRKVPKENIKEKDIDIEREFKERAPTLEALQSYCKEQKLDVNAEIFFNYYSANGWLVGQTPMQDWKACLQLWARRDAEKRKQDEKAKHTFEQHDYTDSEINALFTDLENLEI